MSKVILDKISDAIDDVKKGKIIIVVDDENRENEGDFICAADLVTPEIINFMAKHARGLICMPITEKRSRKLNLYPMVTNNTDPMDTAFTVSVDLKGSGVTSGISASDRSKTIKAIVDKNTKPEDLARPGHIFPLIAKGGGVLRRTGHTTADLEKKLEETPSCVPKRNMVTLSTPSNLNSSTNLETQAVCSAPFRRVEILMAESPDTSASTTILRMGHALGLLVFTMKPVVDGWTPTKRLRLK